MTVGHLWQRAIFIALAALALGAAPAWSMCAPFPCQDCFIQSQGELNLVVMDRAHGQVRLIPNIRVVGASRQFALLVPTPTAPSFATAHKEMWSELAAMTSPAVPKWGGGGWCKRNIVYSPAAVDPGIRVVSQQTVGDFLVTVLTATDPQALVEWLQQRSFAIDSAGTEAIRPYTARGWYFTAMVLDTAGGANPMPAYGWNNSVDPVEIRFAATNLEVPLPILGINRGQALPIAFYVVDDHRVSLPGFTTRYANHLDAGEIRAIGESYPHLAPYLGEGRFLTRMDHYFYSPDSMNGSIFLKQAPADDEYRWDNYSWYAYSPAPARWGLEMAVYALPWPVVRLWRRVIRWRRKRKAPTSP